MDRLADSMLEGVSRTMVYLLAYGGLRWGEMAALPRHRIDVLARRIQISERLLEVRGQLTFGTPRTHRPRTIQVPGFVASLIGQHHEDVPEGDDSLVFTAPRGAPLRYSNMRRNAWNPARISAGTDLAEITPHDLRHTCASLMRAAGADVKEIQQQLGHRSATVTLNTYTHLFEGDLAGVMDRLDDRLQDKTRPERVPGEVRRLQPN